MWFYFWTRGGRKGMIPKDSDCIFCKIVSGEIPCAKVYESENVFAFLDIAPVRPGHALVVTKGHYPTLLDIPEEMGAELTAALKAVGNAVIKATGAHGLNLMQNNHEAAGQLVHHAHFHLIPRFTDDGLELWPQAPYENNDEMTRLAADIAAMSG